MTIRSGCGTLLLICLIFFSGCISGKTAELISSYDRANMRDTAVSFIRHSDVYQSDGSRLNCAFSNQLKDNMTWETKCVFTTMTDEKNHNIDVSIVNGAVKKAILDNKTDMVG